MRIFFLKKFIKIVGIQDSFLGEIKIVVILIEIKLTFSLTRPNCQKKFTEAGKVLMSHSLTQIQGKY